MHNDYSARRVSSGNKYYTSNTEKTTHYIELHLQCIISYNQKNNNLFPHNYFSPGVLLLLVTNKIPLPNMWELQGCISFWNEYNSIMFIFLKKALLTSARKSTPHDGTVVLNIQLVKDTRLEIQNFQFVTSNRRWVGYYRDLDLEPWSSVCQETDIPVQLQTFSTAGLFALLIENPLHAGSILGKDKHTESFVKKLQQF